MNKKMKNRLKAGWWKKEDKNGIGVQLRAISETPFAPFYAPTFPATSPMYGAADAPGSYSPSGAPLTGATGSLAGDTTGSASSVSTEPSSTADASADSETPTGGSKKNKKRAKK